MKISYKIGLEFRLKWIYRNGFEYYCILDIIDILLNLRFRPCYRKVLETTLKSKVCRNGKPCMWNGKPWRILLSITHRCILLWYFYEIIDEKNIGRKRPGEKLSCKIPLTKFISMSRLLSIFHVLNENVLTYIILLRILGKNHCKIVIHCRNWPRPFSIIIVIEMYRVIEIVDGK